MDSRVNSCSALTERDIALLYRIEAGLAIMADVSRSDVMLCCLMDPPESASTDLEIIGAPARQRGAIGEILVARHAAPKSLSSIYRDDMTGRTYPLAAQPTVHRALMEDRRDRRSEKKLPPERTSNGAPVIQQVYTVHNAVNQAIAALLIETSLIEYERHRSRGRPFRQAVRWLQRMAVRGEIETAGISDGFGSLDGIYLIDEASRVRYMNGIAVNLFRSIGLVANIQGAQLSDLEDEDDEVVGQAMQAKLLRTDSS